MRFVHAVTIASLVAAVSAPQTAVAQVSSDPFRVLMIATGIGEAAAYVDIAGIRESGAVHLARIEPWPFFDTDSVEECEGITLTRGAVLAAGDSPLRTVPTALPTPVGSFWMGTVELGSEAYLTEAGHLVLIDIDPFPTAGSAGPVVSHYDYELIMSLPEGERIVDFEFVEEKAAILLTDQGAVLRADRGLAYGRTIGFDCVLGYLADDSSSGQ